MQPISLGWLPKTEINRGCSIICPYLLVTVGYLIFYWLQGHSDAVSLQIFFVLSKNETGDEPISFFITHFSNLLLLLHILADLLTQGIGFRRTRGLRGFLLHCGEAL
jgi:hypothetical protein